MRPIDADALHKTAIVERRRIFKDGKLRTEMVYTEVYRKEEIDNAPAIEAVPVVHGYWIVQNEGRTRFKCSNCQSKNHEGYEKFCPNCGARMDGKAV